MPGMPFKGFGVRMSRSKRKFPLILLSAALCLTACLVLGGCLPPKTIIAVPEALPTDKPKEVSPQSKSPSEEEVRLEKLIRQLEETEQRLLETQRKTEEALKKVESASEKTDEAVDRIQKAREKIEAIGQKETP